MSLFEDSEPLPLPPVPDPIRPQIDPPGYDGITIDTEYRPSSAILLWASGSNWTVDYYSQVLGNTSEPTPQDLNREPKYQQYRVIRNMPTKVLGSLQFNSIDEATRLFDVTGNGYTFPFLTPNKGDMIVANVGDGRLGVFTVTAAVRQTIHKDSVYAVNWSMVDWLTPERDADFKAKVIQTFYYSETSMRQGCGPFVTTEEKNRSEVYKQHYNEILKRYLTDFFSQEHSTLLVPDQLNKTYDHFATKAFLDMVSTMDESRVRRIKRLNVSAEPVMGQPTVWDGIVYKDATRVYGASERAQLVSTRFFRGHPVLQAVGYTGIPYIVYPLEAPTDVDSQYDLDTQAIPIGISFSEGKPRRPLPGPAQTQAERNEPWFVGIDPATAPVGTPTWSFPPDIKPVVVDDYYVFSEAFYTQAEQGQSKLELLVRQYLEQQALTLASLDNVLINVYDWDNLERYYYHPVLLALLRTQIR